MPTKILGARIFNYIISYGEQKISINNERTQEFPLKKYNEQSSIVQDINCAVKMNKVKR